MKTFNIGFLALMMMLSAVALAAEKNLIRLPKAGVAVSLDDNAWTTSPYLTDTFAQPMGFAEIFVPKAYVHGKPLEKFRAVQVDFDNRHNAKALAALCSQPRVKKLPKVKGFECVYQQAEHGAQFYVAVKKVTTQLRAPASKRKYAFVRYVTFLEKSPASVADFQSWITTVKELK